MYRRSDGSLAIEDGHAHSTRYEQPCAAQTGQAGSDDGDVEVFVHEENFTV
ncbi:MAG: hypothetical protein M3P06_23710 [Acidobacteriota bacterium]|nr:hypothetical protein [Acidobacteriota bacterium]